MNRFNPTRSGGSYIPLPHFIQKKHSCINVMNFNNQCFKWAILAAMHPVPRNDHPNWMNHYISYEGELNVEGKRYICRACLNYFPNESRLRDHEQLCDQTSECRMIVPKPGNDSIEFKNYNNRERVPFVIYLDCEALLKPVQVQRRNQCIIRSKLHKVRTISQRKVTLNPFGGKRFLLPNGIDTLAWGHSKIPLQ
ncbi:hypothetical protein QAD02_013355 [Eretmocerus hayati]|uniref:Uncharacterized protein n=1 Tax=Eretmocerus hayati TaxID=131215 RepID=A0ACC2P384_9HYME|nr:hypothetical protein QAD02_013355 [Eretmocerus hayati]